MGMRMYFSEKMGGIVVKPPVKFELYQKRLEEVYYKYELGRQIKVELYYFEYAIEFPGQCEKVKQKRIEHQLSLPRVLTVYHCVDNKREYMCYHEIDHDSAVSSFWCSQL